MLRQTEYGVIGQVCYSEGSVSPRGARPGTYGWAGSALCSGIVRSDVFRATQAKCHLSQPASLDCLFGLGEAGPERSNGISGSNLIYECEIARPDKPDWVVRNQALTESAHCNNLEGAVEATYGWQKDN
jgi:hypothetical protein